MWFSFLQLVVNHGRASLRKNGLAKTALLSVTRPSSYLFLYRRLKLQQKFDRKLGLDTTEEVNLAHLSYIESPNREHGTGYQPTPISLFHEMIRGLSIRYEDFVFVDFGSGKGRTLLIAADYPFRRIIGVEYNQYLHQIAVRNLGLYQSPGRQCQAITTICADAATFQIPPEPAVLYFANPFNEVVMQKLIKSIEASWRNSPRNLFAVYYNPVHRESFSQSLFSLKCEGKGYAIFATPAI